MKNFQPFPCVQTSYQHPHNLARALLSIQRNVRNNLSEKNEQQVARYIGGVRQDIHDVLSLCIN